MRQLLIGAGKFIFAARRAVMRPVARLYFTVLGIQYGRDLQVMSMPVCRRHPESTIRLGDHVKLSNTLAENPAGVYQPCAITTASPGACIEVGNHVGMSGVVLRSQISIVIEDYVNLGAGVCVYDSDLHPLDHMARRVHDEREIQCAPVRICRDAFIGAHAIILKGVTIGERSIIGAGSVVTRDIPPDCVAAGAPARVLRVRVEEPHATA
ncbi:MAG: acyltransferase [Bryobacteraceae bacterium]